MMADYNSIARRTFLGRTAAGLGAFALGTLLNPRLLASETEKWRGVINPLHHAPKAKRVIYLYQAGGPSHLETFDYKPKLAEMHGKRNGPPEALGMMFSTPSAAIASEIDGGARVTFTASKPDDVASLQSELHTHGGHLASGSCKMAM